MRHSVAGILAAVLLLAAGSASQPSSTVDMQCLLSNCGTLASACLITPDCQAAQQCMEGCAAASPSGLTDCSNRCFFVHASEAFGALAACVADYNCSILPPVGRGACPADMLARPLATDFNASLLAEAAPLFVAGGADPVNDCMPCQALDVEAQPDGGVAVFWSSIIGGKERNTSYVLHEVAPGVLQTEYTLFGMPVLETYYILDFEPDGSYIFYFYCGKLLGSPYYGAVVYAQEPGVPVPPELAARFAQAVRDAGLQELVPVEQSCTPTYDDTCSNLY